MCLRTPRRRLQLRLCRHTFPLGHPTAGRSDDRYQQTQQGTESYHWGRAFHRCPSFAYGVLHAIQLSKEGATSIREEQGTSGCGIIEVKLERAKNKAY